MFNLNTTLLFTLFILLSLVSKAQTTAIPDTSFEQYLILGGLDTGVVNGSIPTANIANILTLDVSWQNIQSLEGIEDFSALIYLDCMNNQLSSLDISSNVQLRFLECSGNDLEIIDVSNNTELLELHCHFNWIYNLDLTENIKLTDLGFSATAISYINLTQNVNLEDLYIGYNSLLTWINLSQNVKLKSLRCSSAPLTSLNLSNNIDLVHLECEYTQLRELNLEFNPKLEYFNCLNNNLECLNLKSGGNQLLSTFYAMGNDFTCITVDDVAYSTANWFMVDIDVSFSSDCGNSCSLAINEISDFTPTLYPNPTSSSFTIETNDSFNHAIKMYNQLGVQVFESSKLTVDVSELPSGIYFVQLLEDNVHVGIEKLVVE